MTARTAPLDPDSPKGREVTERFAHTLALIELEIADRKRRERAELASTHRTGGPR